MVLLQCKRTIMHVAGAVHMCMYAHATEMLVLSDPTTSNQSSYGIYLLLVHKCDEGEARCPCHVFRPGTMIMRVVPVLLYDAFARTGVTAILALRTAPVRLFRVAPSYPA